MKKHANIPIFIPHMGCKNDCVFCNQRRITGTQKFDFDQTRNIIEESLKTIGDREVQIAFFGGSFTGIDRDAMISLLSIGKEYIDNGRVASLRCSTRPDYIDGEILDILHKYGMKTVELGIQSTCDTVLSASKRGHDAAVALDAMRAVKDSGFELVGQMMIGLPGASLEAELQTAEDICTCGADGARIYPTVVFHDTQLAKMCADGVYSIIGRDDMIYRTVETKKVFIRHGVNVIRVGLSASETLTSGEDIAYGEYDGSVGETVEGLIYRELIEKELSGIENKGCIEITVPKGHTSRASGIKKSNKIYLKQKYGCKKVVITEDEALGEYKVRIKERGGERCI